MHSFNVCSYNMGSGQQDYNILCQHADKNLILLSQKAVGIPEFYPTYKDVENQAAECLKNQADVFCLQEIREMNRPLIQALKGKKFQVVHFDHPGQRLFDTAIVLSTERFTHITNHSISIDCEYRPGYTVRKDIAIAKAIDSETDQSVTFVSAHVPGFSFDDPGQDRAKIEQGKQYCQAIVNKLCDMSQSTLQIIGADMNANPEKCQDYFNGFEAKNFTLFRTQHPTNVNVQDMRDKEREIDFFFAKIVTNFWQKIKAFFVKTFSHHFDISREAVLKFDPNNNASDHLPIIVTVRSFACPSKVSQLFKALFYSKNSSRQRFDNAILHED